jgi:hypothetical protein
LLFALSGSLITEILIDSQEQSHFYRASSPRVTDFRTIAQAYL